MKTRPSVRWQLALVILAGLLLVCSEGSSTPTSVAPATPDIADLAWISGDWQTPSGQKAQIEEHWTTPAGATMMGLSRTVAQGKTVEFEYLRIEQRADGIYYVAHPKGRCPGTDFKLTSLTGKEAVFENPEHDFPKRIIYRKSDDGSLVASIDGGPGTKTLVFPFRPMSK